ncbi:MAG: 3-methyl-2-oxobutanoate hydroxymethyltransferase [Candidatus Omnitrophota bacterium]
MIKDDFIRAKRRGKKWVMLTAYDAPTAELLEVSGVDLILVGDSLGMVLLGYPSTVFVTMDEMIHHAKAVRRGAKRSFIIGDLPLKGIEKGPRQALGSARRFLKEGGCDAVKLEWGSRARKTMELLIRNKIPVMGHAGLTPQTAAKKGGFRVQGREAESALAVARQAEIFEKCGAFSVLLECVPVLVAKAITEKLAVPTIGIGAGPHCDGQVLVFHDLVGIFKKFRPRFVKRYARLDDVMRKAVGAYVKDVREGKFPSRQHSFSMKKEEFVKFEGVFDGR